MLVEYIARSPAHTTGAKRRSYYLHIYWGRGDYFPHFSASEITDDAVLGLGCPTHLFQEAEDNCWSQECGKQSRKRGPVYLEEKEGGHQEA